VVEQADHNIRPAEAEAICRVVRMPLLADSFRSNEERAVFREVAIIVKTDDLVASNREEPLKQIALCVSVRPRRV
jgi:hypothetical protein